MIIFIISFILVLVAVDLFVRFVMEPWICGTDKKNKVSKSAATKLDPSFRLATETMFDGGKPHSVEESNTSGKADSITKEETKS